MNIDNFKDLIEIQSIDLKIKKLLDSNTEEENRIHFIQKQIDRNLNVKDDCTNQIKEHNEKIKLLEKDLFECENKLIQSKDNLSYAKNEKEINALESEIQILGPKTEKLQDETLIAMESLEEIENTLNTSLDFLKGAEKSKKEISNEVERAIDQNNIEIKKYEERIDNLLSLCPAELKDGFLFSRKKHRYNEPIAFSENGSCSKCRYTLTSKHKSDIEKADQVILCESCQRLLAPYSAKNL